jgi:fumarate reductase subunit C
MWSKQKALNQLLTSVIVDKNFDLFPTLEEELNRNYDDFLDILRNPVIIIFNTLTSQLFKKIL